VDGRLSMLPQGDAFNAVVDQWLLLFHDARASASDLCKLEGNGIIDRYYNDCQTRPASLL